MNVEIQVVSRPHETLQAKVDRLVRQRVAEIVGRKELSAFQPFFESKKFKDELRRLQTAPDWHKWPIHYATWGCLACGDRESAHHAVGMCLRCFRRTAHRLNAIVKRLNEKSARAEEIIDAEQLAYKALREIAPPKRKALPALTAPKRPGRPHLKPQMSPEEAGPRMRKLRKLAGLSHERLAKAAGVTEATVINFEKGRHQMLPGNLAAVKRALVDELVRAFWP